MLLRHRAGLAFLCGRPLYRRRWLHPGLKPGGSIIAACLTGLGVKPEILGKGLYLLSNVRGYLKARLVITPHDN
ncbi:hypothetical protein KTH_00330 [Thermosporothrix hazakensis]|nr:hypothetical protein KTH_00330 [Thermosporothrix hazakensis]